MKRTIKSLMMLCIAATLVFASCKKDDTTTTTTTTTDGPIVTLTDSFGTNNVSLKTKNAYLILSATPTTGRFLTRNKLEIKVGSNPKFTLIDTTVSLSDSKGTKGSLSLADIIMGTIAIGDKIIITLTSTDDKSQVKSASITYTVIDDKSIQASGLIELGAQSDSLVEYKFLGIADNFNTYTSGTKGTAKDNSKMIDFVYYYGATGMNAFAAPANVDGAQVIWGTEIMSWSTKNATMFKATTITKVQFINSKQNDKNNTLIKTIDFSTGATDKITNIVADQVIAFKTASGIQGLIYFSAVAADKFGSTKVMVINEN